MQPETLFAAQTRQFAKRIDYPRVRGAGVGDHGPGIATLAAIFFHRLVKRLGTEAEAFVRGHRAQLFRPQAHDLGGAIDRPMPLFRDIQDRAVTLVLAQALSSNDQGGQIRFRSAACENAGCLGRITEKLLEPVENHQLHLCRSRGFQPDAGKEVRARAQQIAEHRDIVRCAGDKREEARVIDAKAERRHLLRKFGQHVVKVGALFRCRFAQ